MFKNLTITGKLYLGFSLIILILMILASLTFINYQSTENALGWNEHTYQVLICLDTLVLNMVNMETGERGFVIGGEEKFLEPFNNGKTAFDNTFQQVKQLTIDNPKQQELLLQIQKEQDDWYNNVALKIINLRRQVNSQDQAFQLESSGIGKERMDKIRSLIDQSKGMENDLLKERSKSLSDKGAQTRFILIFGTICAVLLALFLSYLISSNITRGIKTAITSANESTEQIAVSSRQLSATAQQLSQGSSEQASSIEETSSTLQETASMVQQNNNKTKQAAQLSEDAKTAAEKGNQEMHDMLNAINEIKKSSDQIIKIVKVIDDIAFQTNILALNAAVEAARAGEAGMGFAVVAEEVRNLAQRSAQAVKDTTVMIETNINLSTNGVSVASKVKEALNEITNHAKKVNELMQEISMASQEQSQGIDQVNKAITQVEMVTQQNASSAEETASSSEALNEQVRNLRDIIGKLSELINGQKDIKIRQTSSGIHSNIQPPAIPQNHRDAVLKRNKLISGDQGGNISTKESGYTTKVISPNEVIPLDKDNHF